MSGSNEDLNSFHEFAISVRQQNTLATVEELVVQWRKAKERDEVNEVIRQGLADIEAGKGRPASEAMAELKAKYNLNLDQ